MIINIQPFVVFAALATHGQAAPQNPIQFSGYLDVSYNKIQGKHVFGNAVSNRVFDVQENGSRWQQLGVVLSSQPASGLGWLINTTAGHDADVIAAYGTDGAYNGNVKLFDVTQAFAQYAKGAVTVTAGKFVTMCGNEVIDSRGNPNFSRSILFGYAIPFTHTGIRVNYAPGPKWSAMVGVNEGWDTVVDINGGKTIEACAIINPNPKTTLCLNSYFGSQRVNGLVNTGPEGNRTLVDANFIYTVDPKTKVTLNADFGSQANASLAAPSGAENAKWSGFAGYVTKTINDKWKITARFEAFDDHDGYRTGIVQKWNEGTVTLGFTPKSDTEIRFEARSDSSNVASFLATDSTAKKTLNSYGVQYLLKF